MIVQYNKKTGVNSLRFFVVDGAPQLSNSFIEDFLAIVELSKDNEINSLLKTVESKDRDDRARVGIATHTEGVSNTGGKQV